MNVAVELFGAAGRGAGVFGAGGAVAPLGAGVFGDGDGTTGTSGSRTGLPSSRLATSAARAGNEHTKTNAPTEVRIEGVFFMAYLFSMRPNGFPIKTSE